jgi:hypothetical protein
VAPANMEDEEERIRVDLSKSYMEISREDPFMFDNIDSFVALSQEKTSVEDVELYPFYSDTGNYEVWDKVGQMVGNFTELKSIDIHFSHYTSYHGEVPASPD